MKVVFLKAKYPLTKAFEKTPEGIQKSSYPNAYEFTSIEEEVKDLKHFAALMTKHAASGHCLLKGMIARDLTDEPRAGSTDSTAATVWACLDVDGSLIRTPDDYMRSVGLGDVSYVVQYSASYKIVDDKLRCHIFVMLDKPYAAPLLKQKLIAMNFEVHDLEKELALTRTGNALRYSLDITTCQNDKLIYIADPECKGFKAPVKDRIVAVKKKHDVWTPTMNVSMVVNQARVEAKIVELRKKANLPERTNTYKMVKNIEVLGRPDKGIITGIKEERGFVYINLNGGDSWGYYHPSNNPEFIHNFKGEPSYLTKELLPEYWQKVNSNEARKEAAKNIVHKSQGVQYLAFLDKRSGAYWRGTFEGDKLDLYAAKSETQIRHFALQNGFAIPDYIPEWDMEFNPHADYRVDNELHRVNTYQPTEFLKPHSSWGGKKATKPFPIIERIIRHATGSMDEIYIHFINWTAFIVQEKDKALTAWVLQGRTGTGKGLLMNHILTPLFGLNQVAFKRMEELEEQYNGFMEKSFIVFVDEVQTSVMRNERSIMAKLKNFITEPMISVRNMYQMPYNARNYTNWIFASNMPDPVRVDMNDRRFNVGRYQDEPLKITREEIVSIADELPHFARYLMEYKVDLEMVKTPLHTEDRDNLMRISEASIDTVAGSLLNGDFAFFLDQLPTGVPSNTVTFDVVEEYKAVLSRILSRVETEGCYHIARDELRTLFEWTVGDMPKSPNKFTSRMKHHRIHTQKVRIGSESVYGITVKWKDLDVASAKARLTGKPVSVKQSNVKKLSTKGKM